MPPKRTIAHERASLINPRRSPGSRSKREAAKGEPYFALCLALPEGIVPRCMGDNRGCLPACLFATTERRDQNVIRTTNLAQATTVHYRIVERVVVPTKEHLERLKEAVGEMLLGHQTAQDNVPLQNKFRDVLGCFDVTVKDGHKEWWGILLQDAQRILSEGAREFPIYDDAEYDRRLEAAAKRLR